MNVCRISPEKLCTEFRHLNSRITGQPNWVQALPLYYTSFTLLNRRWRNADTSVDWPYCIKFWTNMWQCRWISWIWFCVIDLSDDLLLNKDLRYLVMLQLSFRTCRVGCFSFFFWLRVLDKAEYSAFQSTLNSPIVSYRIVFRNPLLPGASPGQTMWTHMASV